jgi:hypothetical protein
MNRSLEKFINDENIKNFTKRLESSYQRASAPDAAKAVGRGNSQISAIEGSGSRAPQGEAVIKGTRPCP